MKISATHLFITGYHSKPLSRGRGGRAAFRVALALVAGASSGPVAAQVLHNRGAHIIVQNGANIVVQGTIANPLGSTLSNAGTVRLSGNFVNAGALSSAGWLVFAGTTDQTFSPGAGSVAQVEVRNTGAAGQNRVLLPADATLSGQLLFTQGLLRTGPTAFLTLPVGATVQGEAPARYVQGNLRVVREQVAGVVNFGNGLTLDATNSPLGTVTATRTAGLATVGVSYATDPNNAPMKSIDRIWVLASTIAPTAAIPLTLEWTADDDNGLTDFSAAQVWQQGTGNTWFRTTAPTAAPTRIITSSITSLSRLTVSNEANPLAPSLADTPLPVKLTRFAAERQGTAAWLSWATATEHNSARFEVESSTDGRQFRRIASVASRGTNSRGATYEAHDPQLDGYGVATVYYRLRQVDRDSTATLSPVRAVSAAALAALRLQAYPNPFGPTLNLALDAPAQGAATLVLLDALGRPVWRQTTLLARGANTFALPIPAALPAGLYLLSVTQGGAQQRLALTRQ